MENVIIQGDCLIKLKEIPDNSVDSVVTDPPAGISFMGKSWDDDKGGRDKWIAWLESVMRECYRVLKPGGHIVVWAIPRTSHWTAMAIENAKFQIRDIVHHIFNTGFPKSLNIGKMYDKKLGNEREVVGKILNPDSTNKRICMGDGWQKDADSTKGTSEWEGWGSAIKPACEHWILAKKPNSEKTIVDNVIKWGTGGLNIDGCRIPINGEDLSVNRDERQLDTQNQGWGFRAVSRGNEGRFPANLVVEDDALNDGFTTKANNSLRNRNTIGMFGMPNDKTFEYSDSGSKSRYFDIDLWSKKNGILQIPKPSKSEKNKGCEGLEEKRGGSMMVNTGETMGLGGSSLKGEPKEKQPDRNNHPTVKSIKLMSWLVKLVTPKGGIVLDPFAGSGTTLVAAKLLGKKYIGIEMTEEYIPIIRARLKVELEDIKIDKEIFVEKTKTIFDF